MDLFIRPLSEEEARSIYRLDLRRDFPPNEIKSWSVIRRRMKQNAYLCLGLFRDELILGYAFFALNRENALLDYFAILPDYRDQGFGSYFLRKMPDHLPDYPLILVEAETPEAAEDDAQKDIRTRRIAFYDRNGVMDTGLRVRVFGVDFTILALPADPLPTTAEVQTAYGGIYASFLPSSVYQSQVLFKRDE